MAQKEPQNEPCGVLVIDKQAGMTSHDIVNKVRSLYGTRRVGHTGTLDPMATGVLTVLVGRAAKAAEYLAAALAEQLDELKKLSPAKLRDQRYEKFRAIGEFSEQQTAKAEDAQ